MRRSIPLQDDIRQLLTVFSIAVALNYAWELAQARLYVGMESWGAMGWHCFIASLGDGILVWMMHATGWAVFRRPDWYVYPSIRTYALMLGVGLVIGMGVEWIAIHALNRWSYTTSMPLVSGLDIGLVPVLQMLLLPPLVFLLSARWTGYQVMR